MALPYKEHAIEKNLSKMFFCKGIPYLVVLDGLTGELRNYEA